MKLRFYNRDGRWFADVPGWIESGGTEDDCEMVSGADLWLDHLSNGDNIFLELSEEKHLKEKLEKIEEDEFGATYLAETYKGLFFEHKMWLCPVTKFLFDKYPNTIYYEIRK
jgi:hypothetical protein